MLVWQWRAIVWARGIVLLGFLALILRILHFDGGTGQYKDVLPVLLHSNIVPRRFKFHSGYYYYVAYSTMTQMYGPQI